MTFIKLSISPDTTFLNSLLFEGLLFTIKNATNKIKFEDFDKISVTSDSFVEVYSKLDDNVLNKLTINTVGRNDAPFWQNLFKSFNITIKEGDKITSYSHILNKLKNNSKNLIINRDFEIGYNVIRKKKNFNFIIDKGEMTAPQLFKVERYTGITSLESDLSTEQITVKSSREILLLALIGIYSSFVITTRILKGQTYKTSYYFLFLSPEEYSKLIYERNINLIDAVFRVKDKIKEGLKDILDYAQLSPESLIIETLLNLSFIEALEKSNLDKISLILFRIDHEKQTYKIYDQLPIYVYRRSPVYEILDKYFNKKEEFCEEIIKVLSKRGIIGKSLINYIGIKEDETQRKRKKKKQKEEVKEAPALLRAIKELYKFIVFADTSGLFGFLRNLQDAVNILRAENKRLDDMKRYVELISKIEYYARKY
jgi:hypothetical protein